MAPAHRQNPLGHHHRYHSEAPGLSHASHQDAHKVQSIHDVPATHVHPHSTRAAGNSLSLPPPVPITATAPQTHPTLPTTPSLRTKSTFPRPSPPSFLYPQPIVPAHVYEALQPVQAYSLPGLHSGESAKVLGDGMQTWLAVVVCGIVAVAGCWSCVVALVHWRGVTTGMGGQSRREHLDGGDDDDKDEEQYEEQDRGEGKGKGRAGRWWTTMLPAKCTTYDALPTTSSEMMELDNHDLALSSAHDVLTHHPHSPDNPFLTPRSAQTARVRPRGSAEWAAQHRAFFAAAYGETATAFAQDSPDLMISGAEAARVELEAREADDGRAAADTRGDAVSGREERGWVDKGLAAVDGAVERVAARIVRWTDDGGRDDELVLPLAKGHVV